MANIIFIHWKPKSGELKINSVFLNSASSSLKKGLPKLEFILETGLPSASPQDWYQCNGVEIENLNVIEFFDHFKESF
jgi:hypothetical protein